MMKKLALYLNVQLIRMIFFVLLGLLAIYLFFDFMGQVNTIGQYGYQLIDAVYYLILRIPSRIYEQMPIAVLMGTIFTLSLLNSQSEITVMRTAGISLLQIMWWMSWAGVICALLTFLLGEYIVPESEKQAEQLQLTAKKSMIVGQFESGLWVKDQQTIVNIRSMLPDMTLQGVRIYTFSPSLLLTEIREAQQAIYERKNHWVLTNVIQTTFLPEEKGIKVMTPSQVIWETNISPETLAVLLISPDKMSILSLYHYIAYLKANKQKTNQYEIALWNKLLYPFTSLAMMVIALPFSFQYGRRGNVGVKMFIGVILGLGFYFISKLTAYFGQLYLWPTLLTAFLPLIIFLSMSIYLLKRQEKR